MEIFCFEPRYEYQTVSGYKVLISQFESGKEQRRYKRRLPREWRLGFSGTYDLIASIMAFHNAQQGTFRKFLWKPLNESEYIHVRFVDEQLQIQVQGRAVASVSLTLREVFD